MMIIDEKRLRERIDETYPFDEASQSRHGIADIAKGAIIRLLEEEMKPCEDSISRKAALSDDGLSEFHYYEDYVKMRNYLKSLPSVTPQEPKTEWIPVSDKLPEINQRVLVTSYGRVCYAMMTSEDGNSGYPVFRLQDSLKERVVCETTEHSEFTTSRIKAWMPLPEPYQEVSSD